MRTARLAGEFNLLCWLVIFTAKDIAGESKVEIQFFETAELIPPPNELDDSYLLNLGFDQRKVVCKLMSDKIRESSHYPVGASTSTRIEYREDVTRTSLPSSYSHAPKANVYKFDDKEECLSIRCASFPPFYVSHEMVNKNEHHWHIRIEKPDIEGYEFRFETILEIVDHSLLDEPNYELLPPKTHYFYKMDSLKRWYLCMEARRIINLYADKNRIYDIPEEPHIYRFKYTDNYWKEYRLAIKCWGRPLVLLRTGDIMKNETNIIWITLQEDCDEKDSENATDGIEVDQVIHDILGSIRS